MAPSGRLLLHTGANNKNAAKALIVASFLDVKIDVTPDFQMGVSNKTLQFLKMNPMGKVPVLETPEGPLFESNAIARYVARLKDNDLLGTSLIENAHVDQWIDFATTEIDSGIGRWLYPRFGFGPYSAEVEKASIANVERAFGALNTYLASHSYLVGDSVTLADIILVSNLSIGYRTVFTEEFTKGYPHIDRYFFTLANQPHFKKVLGKVVRGEREVPPPPSKGAQKENAASKQAKKQEKTPPKPKEEPKEVPKPKEESLDEEEEAPKPKAKSPLDLLPPSKMVLDEWKRLYSNTKAKDFREVAIKGFWDMYDPEGYSLWFCDYKYNEENNLPYVTMNKVSGFLQRMDFIRKYGFAKICIFGEAAPYKIKGVWLFRGSDIPQQVKDECYDVELYEWTKIDLSDEAQKEKVNAYFEEPDVIEGEKLLESKCFK